MLTLITLHFIGDFLLQTDWMALNKSKRWDALAWHCVIYSSMFISYGLAFAGITFCLHFLTDAVTSRITSRLWFFERWTNDPNEDNLEWRYVDGKRHWFFVAIGADQLIHYWTLAWTLHWLTQ